MIAVLQTLKDITLTISALAVYVLRKVTPCLRPGEQRVDFVTDQYPQISIKYVERAKRSQKGVLKINIQSRDQKCPNQWQMYLSLGENKTKLVHFLFLEWNQDWNSPLLQNVMLFVCHGNQCHRLTAAGDQVICVYIPELSTEQEEADTRFFYMRDMRRFMVLKTLLLSRQIQMLLCLEVLCPQKFHQPYFSDWHEATNTLYRCDCHWSKAWKRCDRSTSRLTCILMMWHSKCLRW